MKQSVEWSQISTVLISFLQNYPELWGIFLHNQLLSYEYIDFCT